MKTTPSRHLKAAAILIILMAPTITQSLPRKAPGAFDDQTDVGKVINPGTAFYDEAKDEYTIIGSGANMWGRRTSFISCGSA